MRTTFQGIEAVGIAYLVYTFTWYESAQFSHLAWWALSAGLASPILPHPVEAEMNLTKNLTPDKPRST